jgi:hypothetical protein
LASDDLVDDETGLSSNILIADNQVALKLEVPLAA